MVQAPFEKTDATYADLEALPPHLVGELVGGRLVASPRPSPRHAQAASGLGVLVGGPYHFGHGGPGGWWILDEPELHLGGDVLVPDLVGWRRARLPALPDGAHIDLAPDWVCEVVSPSTERVDRGEKRSIYHRERVTHLWLLSPQSRTLEVLRLAEEGYLVTAVHTAPGPPARVEPFPEVALDLALLLDGPPA